MGASKSSDLRTFGRRRGRKLSERQQRLLHDLLPGLAVNLAGPCDPRALFGRQMAEIWLEIGFGGGEHLLWQAEHNPQVGIIGCEPFEDGVVKVLSVLENGGIGNVRLHADDARPLLRWLPDGAVSRAFILFPDPWPKRRHVKRRFVNRDTLGQLARVMRADAELRLATDIGDYARTMLIAMAAEPRFEWRAQGPSDWRQRPPDWPATRYEAKAVAEGRARYYFRFRRAGRQDASI